MWLTYQSLSLLVSTMAFEDQKLHFVLFLMMAQGHTIPRMDITKILAHHPNVVVTILTTPQNASRFSSIFQRFLQSGLHFHLIQLQFPSKESGLPEGCENLDMLTSLGGFLIHCGWNSTIEAMCACVPMVTRPLFADQFFNEILVMQILKVGVKIGVKSPTKWGEEEETSVLVKKEDIEKGIERLRNVTNESEERRKRIRELGEMAKKAVEKGGSSHSNITFIYDIMKKVKNLGRKCMVLI